MHTRKLALFMTNAPTWFSYTRLPANVMLDKNNGNNSMASCERLDENDTSTTRYNEVITCTAATNTPTKIMSPLSWYRARHGVEDQIVHCVLKTTVSLHYYNGGTIAKHSNFSLQRVTLSSRHVTRYFRQRGEVM